VAYVHAGYDQKNHGNFQLKQAFDSSIIRLLASGHLVNFTAPSDIPTLVPSADCIIDLEYYTFPPITEAVGVFARILNTGVINIGFVNESNPPYFMTTNPPSGLILDLMIYLVATISDYYEIEININFMYYPDSEGSSIIFHALLNGEIDTVEADFSPGGFTLGERRNILFEPSCLVESSVTVGWVTSSTNVTTYAQLTAYLMANPGAALATGGAGTQQELQSLLPGTTIILSDLEQIYDLVTSNMAIGIVGTPPPNPSGYNEITFPLVSGTGGFFRRDVHCQNKYQKWK